MGAYTEMVTSLEELKKRPVDASDLAEEAIRLHDEFLELCDVSKRIDAGVAFERLEDLRLIAELILEKREEL